MKKKEFYIPVVGFVSDINKDAFSEINKSLLNGNSDFSPASSLIDIDRCRAELSELTRYRGCFTQTIKLNVDVFETIINNSR